MSELLHLEQLSIGHDKPLASSLNLRIQAGDFVCLVGPNGCGKSTLLKTIAGLHPALAGEVLLSGQPLSTLSLSERAQRMALVLTRFSGVHGMSAFDSVALGRSPHTGWLGGLSDHDRAQVLQAMAETDTTHLAHRKIDALSDGERQRLAVARALAQEARIILLDEPTAFLDLPHRVGLMGLLRTLCRKQQVAALLSTHDLDLALRFADHVLVLDGQGDHSYGIPETLAMEGVFGKVFSTPQVIFDLTNGSFRLVEEGNAAVQCNTTGVLGSWTRRALYRTGWTITEDASIIIEVHEEAGKPTWNIKLSARDEREVYSLQALLEVLRLAKANS